MGNGTFPELLLTTEYSVISPCHPHNSPRRLRVTVPISQMRKLRLRLVKRLAQGPTRK